MKNLKHQLKKQQGFTIIETMIVLAIAALILVIVFLAVPALQRGSRNSARDNDAAKIAAAVNECLGNNNGQIASCNQAAITGASGTLTTSSLSQLTTVTVNTTAATNGSFPAGANTTTAQVYPATGCGANGVAVTGGTVGANQFAVFYQKESAGATALQKCLAS